jgi:hypothetical protein
MLYRPKWDLDCSQKRLPIKLKNRHGGSQEIKKMIFSAKFERGFQVRLKTHFRLLEPITVGRKLRIRIVICKFRDIGGTIRGRIVAPSVP